MTAHLLLFLVFFVVVVVISADQTVDGNNGCPNLDAGHFLCRTGRHRIGRQPSYSGQYNQSNNIYLFTVWFRSKPQNICTVSTRTIDQQKTFFSFEF